MCSIVQEEECDEDVNEYGKLSEECNNIHKKRKDSTMKQTVNVYDFERAFKNFDRDNFSYEGLKALFEYLEEYEDSTGEELELDVIGLCCEYAEYDSLKEFNNDYGTKYSQIEQVGDDTQLIQIDDNRFIIQQY